jgi:hypothetical protein
MGLRPPARFITWRNSLIACSLNSLAMKQREHNIDLSEISHSTDYRTPGTDSFGVGRAFTALPKDDLEDFAETVLAANIALGKFWWLSASNSLGLSLIAGLHGFRISEGKCGSIGGNAGLGISYLFGFLDGTKIPIGWSKRWSSRTPHRCGDSSQKRTREFAAYGSSERMGFTACLSYAVTEVMRSFQQ